MFLLFIIIGMCLVCVKWCILKCIEMNSNILRCGVKKINMILNYILKMIERVKNVFFGEFNI